jgi:hypothetical protein
VDLNEMKTHCEGWKIPCRRSENTNFRLKSSSGDLQLHEAHVIFLSQTLYIPYTGKKERMIALHTHTHPSILGAAGVLKFYTDTSEPVDGYGNTLDGK